MAAAFENISGKPMADNRKARKKIIVTLGGGGYMWESTRLINSLGDAVDFAYVAGNDSVLAPRFEQGELYRVKSFATRAAHHWWQIVPSVALVTLQAFGILRKAKPDAIIGLGTPICVPLAIAAKLLGIKLVFIESMARVYHPSLTGRILEKLALAERFYVQWPEAIGMYKNAIYKGNVV